MSRFLVDTVGLSPGRSDADFRRLVALLGGPNVSTVAGWLGRDDRFACATLFSWMRRVGEADPGLSFWDGLGWSFVFVFARWVPGGGAGSVRDVLREWGLAGHGGDGWRWWAAGYGLGEVVSGGSGAGLSVSELASTAGLKGFVFPTAAG